MSLITPSLHLIVHAVLMTFEPISRYMPHGGVVGICPFTFTRKRLFHYYLHLTFVSLE